jgi:hypothetical protein
VSRYPQVDANGIYSTGTKLEDVDASRVIGQANIPTVNFFSNILDVNAIDIGQVAKRVLEVNPAGGWVVCVGPCNAGCGRIDAFSNYNESSRIALELYNIESQAYKLYRTIIDSESKKLHIEDQYKIGNYNDLQKCLQRWNSKDNSDNFNAKRFYNENNTVLDSLIKKWYLSKEKRIIVTANAGYGKTHYMCATAERLSKEMNTYLLFGSKFTASKEFAKQLIELMNIGNKTLADLNDKAKNSNENAIIIIDAINDINIIAI